MNIKYRIGVLKIFYTFSQKLLLQLLLAGLLLFFTYILKRIPRLSLVRCFPWVRNSCSPYFLFHLLLPCSGHLFLCSHHSRIENVFVPIILLNYFLNLCLQIYFFFICLIVKLSFRCSYASKNTLTVFWYCLGTGFSSLFYCFS